MQTIPLNGNKAKRPLQQSFVGALLFVCAVRNVNALYRKVLQVITLTRFSSEKDPWIFEDLLEDVVAKRLLRK